MNQLILNEMKISVKAKPGAKVASVRKVDKAVGLFDAVDARRKDAGVPQFVVSVKERPIDGKANRAIEKAIAEYFHVPVSRVRIVSGHTSREKIIEIEE